MVIRVRGVCPTVFGNAFAHEAWYQRLIQHTTGKHSDIKDDYVRFINEIWSRLNATCCAAGFTELLRPASIPLHNDGTEVTHDVGLHVSEYLFDYDFWSSAVDGEVMGQFQDYGETDCTPVFMGLSPRSLAAMSPTFTAKSLELGLNIQVFDLKNQIYLQFHEGEWYSGSDQPGSLYESQAKWCQTLLDENPIPPAQQRFIAEAETTD